MRRMCHFSTRGSVIISHPGPVALVKDVIKEPISSLRMACTSDRD
jgi:hypothetical protein